MIDPASRGYEPVKAGIYTGFNNWTVTVVGTAQDQNHYIQRDVIGTIDKKQSYTNIGMTHFQDD
jgi:hypothetical protein